MSTKKGIIFDLDGTLWDSTVQITKSWQKVINDYKIDKELTVEEIKSCMGLPMDEIFKRILPQLTDDLRNEVQIECQKYENTYLSLNAGKLYPEIEQTLNQLNSMGYKLYIVTNSQDGYVQAFMQSTKLGELFDDFEMFGRTLLKKEENISLILRRNNIDKAVYVGDTFWDYKAATAAEIPFIFASYGFDKFNDAKWKINCFSELISLVPKII
ncbi:MAG: HAD family hydrolase [Acutalibacteraceae bacterium]